jgi:hypothetical protein
MRPCAGRLVSDLAGRFDCGHLDTGAGAPPSWWTTVGHRRDGARHATTHVHCAVLAGRSGSAWVFGNTFFYMVPLVARSECDSVMHFGFSLSHIASSGAQGSGDTEFVANRAAGRHSKHARSLKFHASANDSAALC